MKRKAANKQPIDEEKIILQLYVSGMSPKSMEAISNMKIFCDKYLNKPYELEIIDIYKHPEQAQKAQIVCSPSLIKQNPLPKKIAIGTMGDILKMSILLGVNNQD